MSLSLSTTTTGATAVLAVGGDIDVYTAPELRTALAALIAAGSERVVVDLSGTGFLDSSALGVLVGANKDLAARGGSLRVVCATPNLLKIFEITKLTEVIAVHPTVEAATSA